MSWFRLTHRQDIYMYMNVNVIFAITFNSHTHEKLVDMKIIRLKINPVIFFVYSNTAVSIADSYFCSLKVQSDSTLCK